MKRANDALTKPAPMKRARSSSAVDNFRKTLNVGESNHPGAPELTWPKGLISADNPTVSIKKNDIPNKISCFHDTIHGNIYMDGLCLRIIDTKEFQRLRYLKQLAACDYVYTGATHTRFEHSLGVAHYAETVVKNLSRNQPYLNITNTDILCVKVAGLCHDLGHGPFSHVFDGVFMKRMRPELNWRHEDGSIAMLTYLLSANNINIGDYNLTERDMVFIQEIIGGTPEHLRRGRPSSKFYLYDVVNNTRSGLDVDKLDYFQRDMRYTNTGATTLCSFDRFIEFGRVFRAETIANPSHAEEEELLDARNFADGREIDVQAESKGGEEPSGEGVSGAGSRQRYTTSADDDSQHSLSPYASLTQTTSSSPSSASAATRKGSNATASLTASPARSRSNSLVNGSTSSSEVQHQYMICYPEKLVREAVDLFSIRFRLHQNVCKHKSVKKVDYMLIDALELADPFIAIRGSKTATHPDGLYRISECVEDPCALSNLTDNVLYLLEISDDPRLQPAQDVLRRIRTRKFYGCMGKLMYERGSVLDTQTARAINHQIVSISHELLLAGATSAAVSLSNTANQALLSESGEGWALNKHAAYSRDRLLSMGSQDSLDGSYIAVAATSSAVVVTESMTSITDSHTSSSAASLTVAMDAALLPDDIIVEKMNIHYGMKQFNPVANMRFFPKDADPSSFIARPPRQETYQTVLPSSFEELALRVYCRHPAKKVMARCAFEEFCRRFNCGAPCPEASQL